MPRGDWKKLPRLYVETPLQAGQQAALTSGQAHYLKHVMRRAPGDEVLSFNGHDGEWRCRLETVSRKGGVVLCQERTRAQGSEPDILLIFAPLKRTHLDFMIQKASELGAAVLQPVMTRHGVAERVNAARLSAIAIEAAEQCERLTVPRILPLANLNDVLRDLGTERRLFACLEDGAAQPAAEAFTACPASRAAFLVGPEGGFTPEEMALIRGNASAIPIHLGPRILRADTAALAVMAIWQAQRGDWS